MNTSLRQLRAFAEAFRHRNITRAAEGMHLTQSAVSILLKQLEGRWKVRLFDRTTRGMTATPAALELIPMVERALRDLDYLDSHALALSSSRKGTVAMAVSASVAASILPGILRRFADRFPELDAVIYDVSPDQLVTRLQSNEVEFSIGTLDSAAPGTQLRTLFVDRLGVICGRRKAKELGSKLTWDTLANERTISVRRGGDIRKLIDAALQRRKKTFVPTVEVSLLGTALAMTAEGLGVAVLPTRLLSRLTHPTLTAIPLAAPIVERRLSIVTLAGRSLSPAARSFIAVAEEHIADTAGGARAA
jgi:DNA-binding transcriptional LysR family regulator